MLVLNRTEVEHLLPMTECIRLMEAALSAQAAGDTQQPPRTAMRFAGGATTLTMPAFVAMPAALGVKVISVFPRNPERGRDSHQGAVLAIDPESGEILALLEAGAITAIRTAAVSAVATRLLSKEGADDLAILGAGVQARAHLEAISTVRTLRRIRIWNRSVAHAQQLAASAPVPSGVHIEVMPTAAEAVRGASIICTVTGSPTPVLMGEWLADGAHINAVGAHTPDTRELDTTAVTRSRIFVDARESAVLEAGDLLIPVSEGKLKATESRSELGEVLIGSRPGRRSPKEITLFKSLGLGIEDVVAAWHVVRGARRLGIGTELPLLG